MLEPLRGERMYIDGLQRMFKSNPKTLEGDVLYIGLSTFTLAGRLPESGHGMTTCDSAAS